MNRLHTTATAALALAVLGIGAAGAAGATPAHDLSARDDAYRARAGHVLTGAGLFRNDRGDRITLTTHTSPAHGSLSLNPDGSFRYTPAAGFTGTDRFTYTVTDAVARYRTQLPPLATIGGVAITGGAYGSSLAPVPGAREEFYGLTDRGPNVDGPDGEKVLPLPGFDPAIGRFRLTGGKAVLEKRIPLREADGTPYTGRVNPQATTGEKLVDLNGVTLAPNASGYDSEGLVAMPDGGFWVSDEYGPFITHFDRNGRATQRLSPFDGTLPRELAKRVPNKGMEGLTVTPDGRTLVGIMQSALQQPDVTAKPANITTLRIVTYDLRTRATHEYIYLLDDPKDNGGAVSEITALSGTTFLVDERDGGFEPDAYKKLFKVDLAGATDVGPRASVPGAVYDGARGGLLLGGATIDALVGKDDTAASLSALTAAGITPVRKSLDVDLGALVTGLDPSGGFFGHDKVEGVATTDGGRTLVISNDNDFGVDGVTNATPPFQLHAKTLPDGTQDDGEYLLVDTTKLPAVTRTATVTIRVGR
ncbi:esterase-like activity of phytase family protein [Actinomadura sp. DC4]|uniref:esterase-like activity of phytase family protein n=1 Tax=Actinomadura sp. DC4 TaxID=3055069 RepID=UPI0025B1B92F|nr:esterase-like activity of phytase family protein [Actinomadura sp. DC4]MDN3356544.1 esterase-like activity of phytase family protein [Actinomadura sp. DC4]